MTVPMTNPLTDDELLSLAATLADDLGELPSRNQLMRDLKVGAARAGRVRSDLEQRWTAPDSPPDRPGPPGLRGGKLVAWTAFVFGSLVSVAANVLASRIAPTGAGRGWTPSVAAELGAAVWPLALLLSVEVLSRIPWPSGTAWALARFGGVGTVAAGSAVISYSHIAAVLGGWGYSAVGAHVGPLVIDGLMTISGFALMATAGDRRRTTEPRED